MENVTAGFTPRQTTAASRGLVPLTANSATKLENVGAANPTAIGK